jgi:plastocyanin
MSVPPTCQAGSRININNNSKNISPPNLCAAPGDMIEVIVTPAGTTASIDGKSGGWPSGSGSSFTITAPEQGTYDYDVTFEDGSCIDPRISVD